MAFARQAELNSAQKRLRELESVKPKTYNEGAAIQSEMGLLKYVIGELEKARQRGTGANKDARLQSERRMQEAYERERRERQRAQLRIQIQQEKEVEKQRQAAARAVAENAARKLGKEGRLKKYRNMVESLWTVRRRNRLSTARRLGCAVRIAHFSGISLHEGKTRIPSQCGGFDGSYIMAEARNLSSSNGHIWVAIDEHGTSQGLVMGKVAMINSVPAMYVETLCSTSTCKNVGIHLMHNVEKVSRRMGLNIVALDAVPSAVRYYARLGYQRTLMPCPSQKARRDEHNKTLRARFPRSLEGRSIQRYLNGVNVYDDDDLLRWAAYKNRWANGNVPMSKCLRKGA